MKFNVSFISYYKTEITFLPTQYYSESKVIKYLIVIFKLCNIHFPIYIIIWLWYKTQNVISICFFLQQICHGFPTRICFWRSLRYISHFSVFDPAWNIGLPNVPSPLTHQSMIIFDTSLYFRVWISRVAYIYRSNLSPMCETICFLWLKNVTYIRVGF